MDIAEHFNGVPIPFLGREAEIKAIVAEFKSRQSKSENSLINVHGPDAIGKSRLILRTIDRLYAGQTDVLYLETGHVSRQFLANFIYPLKTLVQSRYRSVGSMTFIKGLQEDNQSHSQSRSLISVDLLFRFLTISQEGQVMSHWRQEARSNSNSFER